MDNQAGLTARQIYKREYDRKRREDPEAIERDRECNRKRRENPEYKKKEREYARKRLENPEVREKQRQNSIEYRQTPTGKKSRTKSSWKHSGMLFTDEEFKRIYNLYLTQELCNACDCVLTRGGACNTRANMDHCHETGLFRHIICSSCNANDNWKKYFC